MTVDLEEWFHVCGRDSRPLEEWSSLPSNVERASERLFSILEREKVRATVFALGWVASRFPQLLRRLAAAGHEIASHALSHVRLDELPLGRRRDEIRRGKGTIEELVGIEVRGFRAPEWSIRSVDDPTLRLLVEEGFSWDSSLTRVPGLGNRSNPNWPIRATWRDGRSIVEIPPLMTDFFGVSFPVGGAWTGRMLPLPVITGALERARLDGAPAVLTLHPWEFDAAHPPDGFRLATRLMHHAGLAGAESRLLEILGAHPGAVVPLGEAIGELAEPDAWRSGRLESA